MVMSKKEIRTKIKGIRGNMDAGEVEYKSTIAAKFFLKSEFYRTSSVLMLYMPLGKETDTRCILEKALEDGKKIALPVTEERTGVIIPKAFDADTLLEKGGFSVVEPKNTCIVEKSEIDVVVVPGIAFDKSGTRLGFGKGCYDMFLAGINAVKIGFCYDFQVQDKIPADLHDIKMDALVTEKGICTCL